MADGDGNDLNGWMYQVICIEAQPSSMELPKYELSLPNYVVHLFSSASSYHPLFFLYFQSVLHSLCTSAAPPLDLSVSISLLISPPVLHLTSLDLDLLIYLFISPCLCVRPPLSFSSGWFAEVRDCTSASMFPLYNQQLQSTLCF